MLSYIGRSESILTEFSSVVVKFLTFKETFIKITPELGFSVGGVNDIVEGNVGICR